MLGGGARLGRTIKAGHCQARQKNGSLRRQQRQGDAVSCAIMLRMTDRRLYGQEAGVGRRSESIFGGAQGTQRTAGRFPSVPVRNEASGSWTIAPKDSLSGGAFSRCCGRAGGGGGAHWTGKYYQRSSHMRGFIERDGQGSSLAMTTTRIHVGGVAEIGDD